MNLINEMFKNEQALKQVIKLANSMWNIFKNLNPEDSLFYAAMNHVDKFLTILKVEYNYTPAWESEFNIHSDKYWGEMKIKVKGKFEFSKN